MAVLGNAAVSIFVALAAWAFLVLPGRSGGSSVFQTAHGSKKDLLSVRRGNTQCMFVTISHCSSKLVTAQQYCSIGVELH